MFRPIYINISYKSGKFCVAFFEESVSLGIWTCWTFVLHLFVSSWRPIIILSSVLAPTILFGYQTQTNKHYQPRNYSLCISSIAPGRELLLQRIQPKERATTHNWIEASYSILSGIGTSLLLHTTEIYLILQPWIMNVIVNSAAFLLDLYQSIMKSEHPPLAGRLRPAVGHASRIPQLQHPLRAPALPPLLWTKKRRCQVSQRGGEGSSIELWSSNSWSRPYLQFSKAKRKDV